MAPRPCVCDLEFIWPPPRSDHVTWILASDWLRVIMWLGYCPLICLEWPGYWPPPDLFKVRLNSSVRPPTITKCHQRFIKARHNCSYYHISYLGPNSVASVYSLSQIPWHLTEEISNLSRCLQWPDVDPETRSVVSLWGSFSFGSCDLSSNWPIVIKWPGYCRLIGSCDLDTAELTMRTRVLQSS